MSSELATLNASLGLRSAPHTGQRLNRSVSSARTDEWTPRATLRLLARNRQVGVAECFLRLGSQPALLGERSLALGIGALQLDDLLGDGLLCGGAHVVIATIFCPRTQCS